MAYELVEEESTPSNTVSDIVRQPARQASNLLTRGIGLPGDVLSLVNQYIAAPAASAITGKKQVPYEETFLGKAIPTTQQHRAAVESKTGEFLKPQNKVEQFVDDVIEDAALLFVPGGKVTKGIRPISKTAKATRNLAKSIGANLAGETVEQASGSKEAGAYTKAGSLFLTSLLDAPATAKQVGSLYKDAEKNLPKTAAVPANKFVQNIEKLETHITKGRPKTNLSDSEKFVLDELDKARDLVKDGNVNIEQAWAQKRSFNDTMASKKMFDMDWKAQKSAKNLAKPINHFYSEVIADYGKTNPQFYKPFKNADEAFGTLARSNVVTKFVQKSIKNSPATTGLIHLFGPVVGVAALPVTAAYQTGKLSYRIAKSPTLRDIYSKTLKSAAQEDATAFNKYFSQLDDALQKDESNDRYEFID